MSLDVSKASYKVWYEEFIYKLGQFSCSSDLLSFLIDFLTNIRQRVLLNGQHSSMEIIKGGVPQESL